MTSTIVDETFATGSQSHTLTTVLHMHGQVVRITVKRDTYKMQSYATAELLNTEKTWTTLVTEPASDWYDQVPSYYARNADHRNALARIVLGLQLRTEDILSIYA